MKHYTKADYLPDLREVRRLFDEHKELCSDETIREQARRDADHGIPRPDSIEPSPYELELQSGANTLTSEIASHFRAALEMLDARIKAEEHRIRDAYHQSVRNIESIHGISADGVENAFGLKQAHRQFEIDEQRYNNLYSRYGRAPVSYIPNWLYLIFAFLIFVGEIPLNALVFQIFGENQIMTWILAFIIGLAVPVTAHFIGIKLREHEGGFCWSNAAKAFATFSIVAGALYGLSLMRQTYLGEMQAELGLSAALVETSFLFFWLNMAVFVSAITISYLAHDSVPGYQEAYHNYQRSMRRVAKCETRRVKALVHSGKDRAEALRLASEKARDGLVELVTLKGTYDQLLKEGQEQEKRCVQRLRAMIAVYRHELLRCGAGASSGIVKPPLNLELSLENLPEKLVNHEAFTFSLLNEGI